MSDFFFNLVLQLLDLVDKNIDPSDTHFDFSRARDL